MNEKQLSFKISTALKDIIGKDLISDKYIAIFELVKNSYDALAHNVIISFGGDENGYSSVSILDDGIGMNYSDIVNKWLFVAYSEKKEKNRTDTYREKINRNVAGAKGVGRFSCDRLGSELTIITKTKEDTTMNKLEIDWDKFEVDDEEEFEEVAVNYETILKNSEIGENGTKLTVTNLRETWSRDDIIKLKKALMKLVNPEVEENEDTFTIIIVSDIDKENDKKIKSIRDQVNGIIKNDVFERLNIKTTNIKVDISADGKEISTKLYDRGEFVFSINEVNVDYSRLQDISINLFYLNKAAKNNFTRLMGLHNVSYGSVFIYKNGFRVMPYGEPGEDTFNIDTRKNQGYARFLGTREIIGRISIKGENESFVETSSRAHGFVRNGTVESLNNFFVKKVLMVLEKYVVNIISWGEPLKNENNRIIQPEEVSDKILSEFASYGRKSEIISVEYNEKILENTTRDNEDSIVQSIKSLESVAQKSNNPAMLKLAKNVKEKTEKILKENIELEKHNQETEKQIDKIKNENKTREKQVFFLKGITDNKVLNLVNGMHSVYTLSEVTRGNIQILKEMLDNENVEHGMCTTIMNEIYKSILKINKLSELAIKGNQSLKQTGATSLYDFMTQYVNEDISENGVKIKFVGDEIECKCIFDTTSIGIIVDNILSNSEKAGAQNLYIEMMDDSKYMKIIFTDDGRGLKSGTDEKFLFQLGISDNRKGKGFGIGLSHIKLLVEEMGGQISINTQFEKGFQMEMRLRK